jgi:hypothetical protein
MKTFSKKLDCPERDPQQITGQEFMNVDTSEKACSYLKRKLTFLMALAITLGAFLMTACDDEPDYRNYTTPTLPPTYPMVIRSMFPAAGAPGSTVAILGENFGESPDDNYVVFGSNYADVLYVTYGVINIRVPMGIPEGDYRINITSNGQSCEAPSAFRVTKDTVAP